MFCCNLSFLLTKHEYISEPTRGELTEWVGVNIQRWHISCFHEIPLAWQVLKPEAEGKFLPACSTPLLILLRYCCCLSGTPKLPTWISISQQTTTSHQLMKPLAVGNNLVEIVSIQHSHNAWKKCRVITLLCVRLTKQSFF